MTLEEIDHEVYDNAVKKFNEIDHKIEHTRKLHERVGRTRMALSGIKKDASNYAGLYYVLKQQYEDLSNRSILHLGCSHGLLIDVLHSEEKCKTSGIDYNKTTVQFARNLLDIPVVHGNFFQLSKYFSSTLFDSVVAEELLIDKRHSQTDIETVLMEIKKVFRPAGCLFLKASSFRDPSIIKNIAIRHGFNQIHHYVLPNESYIQVFQAPIPQPLL